MQLINKFLLTYKTNQQMDEDRTRLWKERKRYRKEKTEKMDVMDYIDEIDYIDVRDRI